VVSGDLGVHYEVIAATAAAHPRPAGAGIPGALLDSLEPVAVPAGVRFKSLVGEAELPTAVDSFTSRTGLFTTGANAHHDGVGPVDHLIPGQGASPELAQCSPVGSGISRNRRATQREFIETKALRLNVVWWPDEIVLASNGRVRSPGRRLDCAVGLCAHRGWARPVDAKTDLCASQTGLGAEGAQCSLACTQPTSASQHEGAWTGEIGRWQVNLHCLGLVFTLCGKGFRRRPAARNWTRTTHDRDSIRRSTRWHKKL
jgi:hypothetical protein